MVRRFPLVWLVLSALAVAGGAGAGWWFHHLAATTVLEQIHLQDDLADRVIREALEERIEDTEALFETLGAVARATPDPGALVGPLGRLAPVVQPWITSVCVRPEGAAAAACLDRDPTGTLRPHTAPPPPPAPIPGRLALGPEGRPVLRMGAAPSGAVVTAVGSLDHLLDAVLREAQLPGDSHVEVYDDAGRLLVHPNPSYRGATWDEIEAAERPGRDWPPEDEAGEREARGKFVSGETGRIRYRDWNLGGRDLFSHYGPFPGGIPGFLVYSHGLGPVPRRLEVQGWFSAGFGALFVLGVLGVWRLWREADLRYRAERERAEALLARADAETEVQAVLDQLGVWVFSSDADGRILRCNEAYRRAVAQLGVGDPVGRPCGEVTPREICDRCRRGRLGPAEAPERFEARWGGRVLLVTQCRIAVPGRGPEVLHLVEDVTELRSLQGALAASERRAAAATLAASVAHEIRNAVTAVYGYADLLAARGGDADLARRASTVIAGQMDRIRLLANNLTELSRPRPPQRRPTDVASLFRGLVDRLVTAGPLKRFEIVADWPSEPCSVECDPAQVEQVLTNLLLNAADAMGDHGVLRVYTRADGSGVRLGVADSGPGVPPELAERVFEPFVTTKGETGTGLGLYVCRQIAEGHGGRLDLVDTAGTGACFELLLPLAAPRNPPGGP
ncbi:MAG: hypothetical protein D6708_03575 [Candidatus Dadabacteria bacterium]|nr:MAG: hypothetical protein D6708_03575 [Candidatus Dadabacteria bacterium]